MERLIDAEELKETLIATLEDIKRNPKMDGQEMHLVAAIHTLGQMIDDAPTLWEGDAETKEANTWDILVSE